MSCFVGTYWSTGREGYSRDARDAGRLLNSCKLVKKIPIGESIW